LNELPISRQQVFAYFWQEAGAIIAMLPASPQITQQQVLDRSNGVAGPMIRPCERLTRDWCCVAANVLAQENPEIQNTNQQ
jgi:hypothetical protein